MAPEVTADGVWLVMHRTGHGECTGWTFDAREGVIVCTCGQPLFSAAEVVP